MSMIKNLSCILVILLIVGTIPMAFGVTEDHEKIELRNTAEDTFQDSLIGIEDWHDLDEIREDMSADYVLRNDLNENTDGYEEHVETEDGWEPIGSFPDDDFFTGTLDGQDNTIEGLRIDREDDLWVGMFNLIGEDGEIVNLNIENVDITGFVDSDDEATGALAGGSFGDIKNVQVTGDIVGERSGGLLGLNLGTIEETSVDVDVTSENEAEESMAAGLAVLNEGDIIESSVEGSIIGNTAGGVTALNMVDENIGYISDTYSRADVHGKTIVGGLVGMNEGDISHAYAVGEVEVDEEGVQMIGELLASNEEIGMVMDSFALSGENELIGENEGDTIGRVIEAPEEDMKDIGLYTEDDFGDYDELDEEWDMAQAEIGEDETWYIDDSEEVNDGYPFLSWESYILEIIVSGEGSITVDDEEVQTPLEQEFREGSQVDLEANPEEDWYFVEWLVEVDEGEYETYDESPETSVTMDEDYFLVAGFMEHKVELNVEGEGEIIAESRDDEDEPWEEHEDSPVENDFVSYGNTGTEIRLTVEPAEDYEFVEWQGYDEDEEEIIFTLEEDVEITAVFEEEETETPGFTVTLFLLITVLAILVHRKKKR